MKPLNPIMAVLVIASVGASPLRTLATDGDKPTAVAAAIENANSINALTKILTENPDARKDAGNRFEEFLLENKGGKSFVAIDVNPTAAGAVAREWGEKKGAIGSVAMFYFVVGPGLVTPGWVKADPILSKTFVADGKWEPRLRIALTDWTGKSQITKAKEKSQVSAFLNNAAEKSAKVFADTRDSAERDQSIEQNATTGVKVPDASVGSGTRLGNGTTRDYTLKDLYEDGAVVTDVSGPNDPNSRKISMKIYTTRDANGKLVNEIGIFDITNKADIFGQRFSLGDGDQSFVLDDRTPGHKKYELKFGPAKEDGNRDVTFARPDGGKKGGGVPLTTTVSDLFLLRANQAATLGGGLGDIVKVGDQEFYVLPQGGEKSGLVFFPKAATDARSKDNIRAFAPGLYAETGERGSDGFSQRIATGPKGGPHLGTVGDKQYHLVWNAKLTPPAWDVADNGGDLPAPPPKPGDGANPGGGKPDDGKPDDGKPPVEKSITDLENLLLLSPTCKKNTDDTKLMAKDLVGKYGLIACNPSGKPGGNQAILLVPFSVRPDQQMIFGSTRQNGNTPGMALLKGRIVDHYLVLEFDKQVQYLDLLKKTENGFEIGGFVANKDASGAPVAEGEEQVGMTNMIIFLDALRNYMDVPSNSAVFEEVPKRIEAKVGRGKRFDVQAKNANGKLVVIARGEAGSETFQVWPAVNLPPVGPANGQYSKLGGPTNVFEPEVSSMDAPFEPEFPIPNSYLLKLEGNAQKDIALYKAVDPIGKEDPKKYYVSFKYKRLDTVNADPESAKVEKIFRQKYFEVFNADNPFPEKRDMQGLTDIKDAQVRGQLSYRFISGTNTTKGVLAVFQNAQLAGGGQKDAKANCVGPLVWWGISNRDAAMTVCKDDKF